MAAEEAERRKREVEGEGDYVDVDYTVKEERRERRKRSERTERGLIKDEWGKIIYQERVENFKSTMNS